MKEKFEQLLHMVERKRATDVHFTLMQHRLHVQVRGWMVWKLFRTLHLMKACSVI